MKKFNLFTLTLLFITGSLLVFTSCGDDNEFSGEVEMQFNFSVDGDAYEAGKTYEVNGTAVQFNTLAFYVGGISFLTEENTTAVFEDKYLLVTPDNNAFSIGELSTGNYTALNFFIGVDPVTNALSEEDFTTRASSDPLAAQMPSMHWNWNSGYKFIRLDGMSDTDGDGEVETPIAYHIGTDALLGAVSLSLEELKGGEVAIDFDIADLFTDVDLSTELDTHTGNNLPLAQKLVANYSVAFSAK